MKVRVFLPYWSAVLCSVSSATAQPVGLAEALFRQARAEMKAGDYASSCPKLAESQRLDPSPGTLLNLAICEEKLEHLATAWTKYREVVETTVDDARRAFAAARLAALEPRLPHLNIVVKNARPGARVMLDGVELHPASLGVDVPVDPGDHRVVLVEQLVHLSEGERREIHLEASPDPAPAVPMVTAVVPVGAKVPPVVSGAHPVANRSRHAGLERAGIFVGAGGLAGLAGAGVFTVLALAQKGAINDGCDGQVCRQVGLDAVDRGKTYLRIADIALVAGVVGVATGGVLLWQSKRAKVTAIAGPSVGVASLTTVFE